MKEQRRKGKQMRHGKLNRDEAIEIVGIEAVLRLEKVSCEPTNRVQCDGDEAVEYAASVDCGDDTVLTAYYYTTKEEEQAIADADGDGSVIEWHIHGFEIE